MLKPSCCRTLIVSGVCSERDCPYSALHRAHPGCSSPHLVPERQREIRSSVRRFYPVSSYSVVEARSAAGLSRVRNSQVYIARQTQEVSLWLMTIAHRTRLGRQLAYSKQTLALHKIMLVIDPILRGVFLSILVLEPVRSLETAERWNLGGWVNKISLGLLFNQELPSSRMSLAD